MRPKESSLMEYRKNLMKRIKTLLTFLVQRNSSMFVGQESEETLKKIKKKLTLQVKMKRKRRKVWQRSGLELAVSTTKVLQEASQVAT